ncbi:MAG: shikimate dehydrogenase [Leptospiraceae bacterium]|nr:shikimate dehydrogenase [Leptospiraceae bacterium]MCP5510533.1 shikimate dehydrogenase [Leptospiraceae bacterium]
MISLNQINRDTKFYGILGFPLSHTLSPLIHNTLFAEYKQNSVYLVFEKEHPDKYTLFKERGLIKIYGLSVTIPHKEWAFQISDDCDETGRIMEASNTLILNSEEGFIQSFNTDGMGAVRAILETKKNFLNNPKDVLVLGSGGSARGISYALLKSGFPNKIVIAARNEEKGKQIVSTLNQVRQFSSEYSPIPKNIEESKRFSVIINTTPLGMKGQSQSLILPEEYINKNHILFDIVYNPIKTPLVQNAIKNGAKVIPGYEMLLYQAMEQFRLFSGITPSSRHVNQIRKLLQTKLA